MTAWDDQRLYTVCQDAETLYDDPHTAIQRWADAAFETPLEGTLYRYTVLPRGEFGGTNIVTPEWLAEHVADLVCDDAGFEGICTQYTDAAADPLVLKAFRRALEAMTFRQRFLISDQLEATAEFNLVGLGGAHPAYDIGPWTPMSPRVRQWSV